MRGSSIHDCLELQSFHERIVLGLGEAAPVDARNNSSKTIDWPASGKSDIGPWVCKGSESLDRSKHIDNFRAAPIDAVTK